MPGPGISAVGFLADTILSANRGEGPPASQKKGDHMIKKVKDGYKVLSEKTGKNLGGPYKTRAAAEKRLRQVEFFKHKSDGR
jgi:hypothetical protein